MEEKNNSKTEESNDIEKRTERIKTISIICLVICLLISIIAWAASFVKVTGNTIQFGKVDIEIGYFDESGKKYFEPDDGKSLFKGDTIFGGRSDKVLVPEGSHYSPPGEKVNFEEQTFFIENKGNLDAWYTVYFDNLGGSLGHVLDVYIDEVLSDGTRIPLVGYDEPVCAMDFVRDNEKIQRIGQILAGQSKVLVMKLALDEERDKEYRVDNVFTFDILVDAVQMKNNPLQT